MQVLLFSIVAICIAGSRTQEIAVGTEYLRAHSNDSFSSGSAINAQIIELPPAGLFPTNPASAPTDTTTTTVASKDDDNSPEHDDDHDKDKKYGDEHKSHHEHAATISIDVHNILDLFKQELHISEERILAAIQHSQPSNPIPVLKNYRTGDR